MHSAIILATLQLQALESPQILLTSTLPCSQGRRSANTVKNRYQALKKYWVPDGPEAQAAMQESMGSEEDDAGEPAVPPQLAPQIPAEPTDPIVEPPSIDPSEAVRADLPSVAAATATATAATASTEVPPEGEQPAEEVATASGTSQAPVAVDKPEARRAWPIRESVTSPDGPLSHKFMVLQSRLHKASQLIARESDDLQVCCAALINALADSFFSVIIERTPCYVNVSAIPKACSLCTY